MKKRILIMLLVLTGIGVSHFLNDVFIHAIVCVSLLILQILIYVVMQIVEEPKPTRNTLNNHFIN